MSGSAGCGCGCGIPSMVLILSISVSLSLLQMIPCNDNGLCFVQAFIPAVVHSRSPLAVDSFYSILSPNPSNNLIVHHATNNICEDGGNDGIGSVKIAKKLSAADKDRLLLSEPALNAFIVAEMRDFVTKAMHDFERNNNRCKWALKEEEKVQLGLVDPKDRATIIQADYAPNMDGELAVDTICNTTHEAFRAGFVEQQGLLSALGSAICFFRSYFREPRLIGACERIGLSDYAVAHHITDMYHHLHFRGAYTKTLAPSGKGEIAARIAVGLGTKADFENKGNEIECSDENEDTSRDECDECMVWSPTTPGVCLHWKSDDEAWRKRRFERIQMEGTRDPRRGGSGTTR